jgi:hypothetical protein
MASDVVSMRRNDALPKKWPFSPEWAVSTTQHQGLCTQLSAQRLHNSAWQPPWVCQSVWYEPASGGLLKGQNVLTAEVAEDAETVKKQVLFLLKQKKKPVVLFLVSASSATSAVKTFLFAFTKGHSYHK